MASLKKNSLYSEKTGDQGERNQGKCVVFEMVEGLEKSGRNVTTNNFFTSLELTRELDTAWHNDEK
jgi:hypothetical protein